MKINLFKIDLKSCFNKHFLMLTMLFGVGVFGQFSIASGSTDYSQNFNALTNGTWNDNTTLTGWYVKTDATSSITTYGANTGATTTAGLYAFGVAGTNALTDRALGFAPSNAYTGGSGTGKGYMGWRLKNNTGSSISSITIIWSGEQWRRDNASAQSLLLSYQIGSSVTNLTAGTWISTSSLFTSPQLSATALVLDGNATANRTANISTTVTVSIAPGEEIMLRWEDLNDSGNDHFLAIDDITINATVAISCAVPTLSTTTSVTGITTSTANLTGDITNQGGAALTTRAFEYAANSTLASSSTRTEASSVVGSYTLGLTSLIPNTKYYYRAYAINSCSSGATGYSHTSAYPAFTTLNASPTANAATGVTTSGFQANWAAPTGGGSESYTYEIQISTDNSFSSIVANQTGIASSTLNYLAGSLSSGTAYYYRVRTVNAGGNSAWSNIVTVTTNTPAVPVVTSETFNGTVGSVFSANVSATNSPTGYSYTGTLPAGLLFNNTTGAITGTPSTATVSVINISVTATNGVGPSAPATISFNIAKGNQAIAGLSTTQAKIYGDADYTLSATASSGLVVNYSSSDPTIATITGNTISIKKVGTTTITASQEGDSNWNAASNVTQTLTVTAKALTISGLSGVGKVYDRTTTATLSGTPALVTIVSGDDVSLNGAPTANFADYNIGTKSITVTGYTLSGTKASNYTLSQPTGLSAVISAKVLTVTGAVANNKTYDGTNAAAITGTLSGVINPDVVTLSGTGTFASVNAANGIAVTSTSTIGGSNAGNYTLAQPTGLIANITRAEALITPSTIGVSVGGTYTLPSTAFTTNSDGAITYSITPGGFATLSGTTINGVAVGSETLTVNQAASTNYNAATSVTVPVTVSAIAYVNGDFMTKSGGSWTNNTSGTAVWYKRVGGAWVDTTEIPNGTAGSYTVYITENITVPSTGASVYATSKIYINQLGKLTYQSSGTPWTFRNIIIDNGGTLQADARFTVLSGGNFEIYDGGNFIYNYSSNTLAASIGNFFNGTEKFNQNSNFIVKDLSSGNFLDSTVLGAITINDQNSYFGNIIIDYSNGTNNFTMFTTGTQTTAAFTKTICNDLIFRTSNSQSPRIYQNGTSYIGLANPLTIGGSLIIEDTFNQNISFTTASHSTGSFYLKISEDFINNSSYAYYNLNGSTNNSALYYMIVGGDMLIGNNAKYIYRTNINSTSSIYVRLSGDLKVASNGIITDDGTNSVTNGNFWLEGNSLQTIDFKNLSTNNKISYSVRDGASVKLLNQNLALGTNSALTIVSGGTLDFGLNGTTALNVTGPTFTANSGSILKITSADGINKTGVNTGNVQTTARTYSGAGTYNYIGALTPQSTGNAIENTGSATALNLVVNKDNATDVVNLNTNTKTTGELNIVKGTFVETEANRLAGTSGNLTMAADGVYKTSVTSINTPQLSGAYSLAAGSTIELNANANQNFNATNTITYRNLIFSNGGTKTIGNTSENIIGTVTIKDNTTVDASSNTFGGGGTNLTMSDSSKLIIGSGTDPKPRMDGVYNLGSSSTIEFTGTSSTQIRVSATTNPIQYAKVIVSGNNVKAGTTNTAGLTFQSGGIFTLAATGVYKVPNPDGFSGGSVTAIKNTNNPTISLEVGSTVEYNGTADQTITVGAIATPATGNYQNLSISGSGTKSPLASLTVNNLTTVSGGTLKVSASAENASANVLYAHKGVQNTAGSVIFENNAQLLQDSDAVNSGNIQSQRLASNINNLTTQMDYIYWSSPVTGQDLKLFSPGTPTNRIYQYNEATDYFAAVNFTTEPSFVAGKGYAFRAESTVTNGDSKTYTFTGLPNNGDINIDVKRSPNTGTGGTVVHGFNLVGNPYPSNIKFDELYLGNSSLIWNTAYFWTNNNFTAQQVGSNYTPNNYAIYNGTGGNSATKSATGTGVVDAPNGIVKVGQGFIIQKKALGTDVLHFKNSYSSSNVLRVADNGTFFEKSNTPKNRFWLEMTSPNNLINSILVGYIPGASNEFENDFDGELFVVGSDSFYSMLGVKKLAIQGKADSFTTEDVVPLGHVHSVTGNYTIKLNNPEGIFANSQSIYLKDKLLNKYINLSDVQSYSFTASKGTDNTRFEIVYKDDLFLGTNTDSKSDFVVYKDGNDFVIKSSKVLDKIEVYDTAGRMIFAQKATDKIFRLNGSKLTNGVFIIKVENSGELKTKKIIK